MSKILINSESVLKTILGALDFCKRSCVENAEFSDAEKYIKNAIENSKRFSVLEWHPMSEKPKDESDILVKEKDGCVFDTHAFDSVDDGDWEIVRGDKNQIVEWAYPPK